MPNDPVVAFFDALIEDYADEWLTKAMFHYRWAFSPDVAQGAAILPRWFRPDAPDEMAVAAGKQFADRQIGRLGVVGSNPTTAPTIESSYRRLLAILDARRRPLRHGRASGHIRLRALRPTDSARGVRPDAARDTRRRAARDGLVDLVEDLSGLEPRASDWIPRADASEHLRPFLVEIGRVYVPFCSPTRPPSMQVPLSWRVIDGRPWTQRPFPTSGSACTLRAAHAALAADDRATDAITGTGCEPLTTV